MVISLCGSAFLDRIRGTRPHILTVLAPTSPMGREGTYVDVTKQRDSMRRGVIANLCLHLIGAPVSLSDMKSYLSGL